MLECIQQLPSLQNEDVQQALASVLLNDPLLAALASSRPAGYVAGLVKRLMLALEGQGAEIVDELAEVYAEMAMQQRNTVRCVQCVHGWSHMGCQAAFGPAWRCMSGR